MIWEIKEGINSYVNWAKDYQMILDTNSCL